MLGIIHCTYIFDIYDVSAITLLPFLGDCSNSKEAKCNETSVCGYRLPEDGDSASSRNVVYIKYTSDNW
jgi:hypothetical protein